MAIKCYNPIQGIDDVLASKVDDWTKHTVASLRGMYDESHEEPLDISNLDTALEQLLGYKEELREANRNELLNKSKSSNLSGAYQELKKNFNSQERFNRINMISTIFSDTLDDIQAANPNRNRKELCNGFYENGKFKGGQLSIFDSVYDTILSYWSETYEEGDIESADKYQKILENWGALVTYSRLRLRDTEELKLGAKLEYADDTNEENYNDNDMAQLYDPSESTRESWQETSDMKSSFGTLGKEVRKLLGLTQKMENGEYVYDDLGFPIMLDPVKAHQQLLDILRGMTSSTYMMSILKRNVSRYSWLQPIIEELQDNNTLRTQFYVNFRKNFQRYSIMTEKLEGLIRKIKTPILNRVSKALEGMYFTRISLGRQLNSSASVFNANGEINWRNLQKLRILIKDNFISESPVVPSKFWDRTTKSIERKKLLKQVTEALGIELDEDTINLIMSNSKDTHKLTKYIEELLKYGIDSVLPKNTIKSLEEGNYNLPVKKFSDFIKYVPASSSAKEGAIREKINKILSIIAKNRDEFKLVSRVTHKDKNGNNISLFSDVIPSYLGDTMDEIGGFVKNEDRKGLRKYIEDKFFNSSYFLYNGNILNKWIEDLYNSTFDEDSFASNFIYKRFLGTSDNSFENFTSKQHAIDMMSEYFSEKQKNSKSQYAWYPVFILGDSGVSKFIKAKKYSEDEILDGLYKTYKQEKRRIALTNAANEKLSQDNYSLIDNFSGKNKEFSILLFLNKDYKSPDGSIGKYYKMIENNPTESGIKEAIKSYMEEAVQTFKDNIQDLGLLETVEAYNPNTKTKEPKYVYFSQEVNKDTTIDDVIKDYYWNTKFATIQQLQLFTIDPAFYKGTKDLQKRYKEIHAPGSVLDLEAIDYNGNLYSEDGIERCVYFDDIELNAENSNPEFMEAIAANFGKDSDIYKAYTQNTLTDGQGYRTLDSYRKVMGMAGQWSEKMEYAYNVIKSLRDKYGKDSQIPAEALAQIEELAVIFQPIKPYMYTIENYALNDTEILKIPVQHKYAEAVLIPELLPKGSKLRDIVYWMESNNVDMIGSTKIVKVGGFGTCNISKSNDNTSLNEALNKAYIHQLSYKDYRIQTNVPEHINSSQLFGTQVRKLIMANIEMGNNHYSNYVGGNKVNLGGNLRDVVLNGRNLVSFYNSLIVANILESYDIFSKGVGDIKQLSEILLQTTINNSRESVDNLLAYSLTEDNKFLVPLFEGALEHDSAALLFSMFKKKVNKQSIKGGSAVQVSAMGIKGYEESGDLSYVCADKDGNIIRVSDSDYESRKKDIVNILYAECEIPWDITYTDKNGNEVTLNYNDYCNQDGTLKTDEDGDTLLEKEYPNALDILAYRIPTERDYSMINLKIKRFSQKTAGGTIKVPAQGTTIAGFDFDVDKLYFMRNEYIQAKLSNEQIEEIWQGIYQENPELKRVLLKAKQEDIDAQESVTELFQSFFNSNLASDIAEVEPSKNRLYKYWKEAGLSGTPQEIFANYLNRHKDKYSKFETYDYKKSPLENHRAARNNMLIQLIRARLQDQETFKQRYTPGGFKGASKAARTLRELLFGELEGIVSKGEVDFNSIDERAKDKKSDPEPNYDPSDPFTIITYNQQNQVAGKLIGIFANQNTNHAFASLMKNFKTKEPISFAGHNYSDFLNAPTGIDVDLNVAEFLAASVDAVKDPVLNFLNLNTVTADAGAVLARLGYTSTEIGLLFNQPIIKEICDYKFNNNVGVEVTVKEVISKYMNTSDPDLKLDNFKDFSKNQLALNIVNNRILKEQGKQAMDNNSFRIGQLKVAILFQQIQQVAGDVSQFVISTKFTASNAVGSSFGDLYSQQMKVSNYISKFNNEKAKSSLSIEMNVTDTISSPINNNSSLDAENQQYLEQSIKNPFAYEQAMYDMNRRIFNLLKSYYPYETKFYADARKRLASLTTNNFLDADTINSIHSDLLVYALAQQEFSLFNGEMPTKDNIPAREYYTKHFPKEVFKAVESNPELKEFLLFQYIQFSTDESTGEISMNVQDIGGLMPHQKDGIKESWAELLSKYPDLARDLFMFNFYKLGFTFSPLSFMNLAPTELKLAITVGRKWDSTANEGKGDWVEKSYIDFLNELHSGLIYKDPNYFAMQYILNHLDNRKLVINARGEMAAELQEYVYPKELKGEVASSFVLDSTKLKDSIQRYTIKDDTLNKYELAFRPCIVIDDMVYICQGNQDKFNISSSGSITYYKVDKLGVTNKSLQYVSDSEITSKDSQSYDNSDKGSTKYEEPFLYSTPKGLDLDDLVDELVRVSLLNGNIQREQVEQFKEDMLLQRSEDLQDTINYVKEELKTKGLIDKTGKKVC